MLTLINEDDDTCNTFTTNDNDNTWTSASYIYSTMWCALCLIPSIEELRSWIDIKSI